MTSDTVLAPRESVAALAGRATLCMVLDQLTPLRVQGADAIAFLHGQLSCHVTALADGHSSYGSYNTPKGRMLASFLLVRRDLDGEPGLDVVVDRSIAAPLARRLSMFVLRSKVKISDASATTALVGLAGGATSEAIGALGGSAAATGLVAHRGARTPGGGFWLALAADRALGLVPRAGLDTIVPVLRGFARPGDAAAWRWLDVRDGIAIISERTQDSLIPQMANLEAIGGVHFDKGCYPGQEIVARTQHLGKVKRRMYRAHVATEPAPVPGDPVFGADLGEQASGLVVEVAPAPDGGYDLLAVMQVSTAQANTAHLGGIAGPALTLLSLPYAIQ